MAGFCVYSSVHFVFECISVSNPLLYDSTVTCNFSVRFVFFVVFAKNTKSKLQFFHQRILLGLKTES